MSWFLRAAWCSAFLSPQERCVSPQYWASFPSTWQLLQVPWYVRFLFLQEPGLLLHGWQPCLPQASPLQGALLPRLSMRLCPCLSTTFTLPWILFVDTMLSTACILDFRVPSGVWGTKRTVSALPSCFFLLLALGMAWSVSSSSRFSFGLSSNHVNC